MTGHFLSLITLHDLDDAIAASQMQPIVLFKHSLTCGTSAAAQEELQELLDDERVAADIYMVAVQTARAVSAAVTERFGVRHESPQVLIIDRGRTVWTGSHWHVTASEVRTHLEEARRRRSEVSSPA